MEIYSVDEVLDLIAKQWLKDFGQLRDDENDRDGYFMIGFVKAALTESTNPLPEGGIKQQRR